MKGAEHKIGRLDDLPDGQLHEVTVEDVPIVLLRRGQQVLAVGGRCPHYGAPLAQGQLCEGRLVCPWHCASFDIQTGKLLDPPALDDVPKYPVRVDGGVVLVKLPDGTAEKESAADADIDALREEDGRLIAIIGAGGAGSAAAEALREAGYRGRLLLIGDEHPPYDRPSCSKQYLAGQSSDEQISLRSPEFYNNKGIECAARRVSSVDVETRTIVFEKSPGIIADKILLATGAVPIPLEIPGNDLLHVFTLRGWADSRAIRERAKESRHAVVVGDGFIGMEAAASLAEHDCRVTVVSRNSVPMANIFGDRIGQLLRKLHENNGIQFCCDQNVRRLIGEGSVKAVELDDGSRLPADLVVVGIGVRPNTQIVQMYPKNADGGIDVDQYLRLNEHVFAAGDIACYPDRYSGERVRVEHWRVAEQQGRVAARNMVGPSLPYDAVPFFWTRQFGVSFAYAGHASQWDEVIFTGAPEEMDFSAYYVKDDRLLAIAGTQTEQTIQFMEQMRAGRLPAPDRLRVRQPLAPTG